MAEWLKAAVLKTVMGREAHLGFESLPLRYYLIVYLYNLDLIKVFLAPRRYWM